MQALQIITDIIVSLGYTALIAIAIITFFTLRRMVQDIERLKYGQRKQLMLTMGDHIRNNFDTLNAMRHELDKLVAGEHFEEANKLNTIIASTEKEAFNALK